MANQRTKLILTGGGTRGMYQIGVAKALEELGFMVNLKSISACSIGAMNAALLMQYSAEDCKEIWLEFSGKQIFRNIDQFSKHYHYSILKSYLTGGVDTSPLEKVLEHYLDESIIRSKCCELIFSVFNISDTSLEYISLQDIPEGKLIDYILASGRLPIFKNRIINDKKYLDGGIADNEPEVSFLENKVFDHTVVARIVHITKYLPQQKRVNIVSKRRTVISPTKRLGTPLSFTKPDFQSKYNWGYEDTIRQLATTEKTL